jgi:hypothetical protein
MWTGTCKKCHSSVIRSSSKKAEEAVLEHLDTHEAEEAA